MLKYILFDLDGTILPMEQEEFTKKYFDALAKKMATVGLEPEKLMKAIWKGVAKMVENDGSKTNEIVFWEAISSIYDEDMKKYIPVFDEFYRNEFVAAKEICESDAFVPKMIKALKSKGLKLVLATNPIFPAVATERRISWAGLDKDDFELVTVYENSSSAKPNLRYYKEILEKIHAKSEECLMVGNDVSDDMVARKLGIDVFLITKCLINHENEDISAFNQGDFEKLVEYIDKKLKFQA